MAVLIVGPVVVLTNGDDSANVNTADPPVTASVQSSTTTAPTTTEPPATTTAVPPPQAGICAANPVPSADILDIAVHLGFDRTPLELDLDGVDDELLAYDDADGDWWLIARLQSGWTAPVNIGRSSVPGLVPTPDGVPAGTDLDGDGGLEFFVSGYADPTARLLSATGCSLIGEFRPEDPADGPPSPGEIFIGFPADFPECVGRTCTTRAACVADVVVYETYMSPIESAGERGLWSIGEFRLEGSVIRVAADVQLIEASEQPGDVPTAATTGVIDCPPPENAP